MGDSVPVATVAKSLGISIDTAGTTIISAAAARCASILGDAAMAVEAGLAETVVIFRALNGRSGKRMGQIALGTGDGITRSNS